MAAGDARTTPPALISPSQRSPDIVSHQAGQPSRYDALDGLRGIAAGVVVLHHVTMAAGWRSAVERSIVLAPFVAGFDAVLIFFVLSGFVLHLTFFGKDGADAAAFLIKRAARLYPPVMFIVLVAAAAVALIRPHPVDGLSSWFNKAWAMPLDWPAIASHLALTDHQLWLDGPLWSLVVEARYSLVFPLIALAVRRFPWATLAASLAIAVGCSWRGATVAAPTLFDPVATGQYLFLFVAGAVMAARIDSLQAVGARLPRPVWIALFLTAVVSFCVRDFSHGMLPQFGAILLVGLVVAQPALTGFFSSKPLRMAGRVSFSLYLCHLVVLLAVVHVLNGILSGKASVLVALPAIVLFTLAMFHVVERPSMAAGRRLSAKWRRRAELNP